MLTKEQRAAIITKIKALRARAADAASSEAEAAKAAAVAEKLMREHNLTLDEADARADGVGTQSWGGGETRRSAIRFAAMHIAEATNCECWNSRGGGIVFLGSPTDVETALYFMDLVDAAFAPCQRRFQKTEEYKQALWTHTAREVGMAFRRGLATRLGRRILELALEGKRQTPQPTGTGIVLVKNALIREWLNENNMTFSKGRSSRTTARGAYHAGARAAEGVSIGRGIGGQSRSSGAISGY